MFLFFTNIGRVHCADNELMEQTKTRSLVNVLEFLPVENPVLRLKVPNFDADLFIVAVTNDGYITKTAIRDYNIGSGRRMTFVNLLFNDTNVQTIVSVESVENDDEIVLNTRNGIYNRILVSDIPTLRLTQEGVKAIELKDGDELVDIVIASDDKYMLTLTKNGYVKCNKFLENTLASLEGPMIDRSLGQTGVYNINVDEEIGPVVCVSSVAIDESVKFYEFRDNSLNVVSRLTVEEILKHDYKFNGNRLIDSDKLIHFRSGSIE